MAENGHCVHYDFSGEVCKFLDPETKRPPPCGEKIKKDGKFLCKKKGIIAEKSKDFYNPFLKGTINEVS